MHRSAIKGNQIFVRQEKTGKELLIPVHANLRPIIEAIDRNAVTILENSRGRPWTASGFKSA